MNEKPLKAMYVSSSCIEKLPQEERELLIEADVAITHEGEVVKSRYGKTTCGIKKGLHPQQDYGESVMEMLQSLNQAVQQAGGSIFSYERLKKMSAAEMILLLASNGVRFHYSRSQ